MKQLSLYALIPIILTGCIKNEVINIDSYYTVDVLTYSEMNESYQTFIQDKKEGNYFFEQFGVTQGCATLCSEKAIDSNYFDNISSSENYYMQIKYFTNKSLSITNDGRKGLITYKTEAPIFRCDSGESALRYTNIELQKVSNERYEYGLYISIPLEQGKNIENSSILLPSSSTDLCIELSDSINSYFPSYNYSSNRLTIQASDIQAALDTIP